MASRAVTLVLRAGAAQRQIASAAQRRLFHGLSNGCRSPIESKWVPCLATQLRSGLTEANFQRFGFSSSTTPQPTEKETDQFADTEKETDQFADPDGASQNLSQEDSDPDLSVVDLEKLVAEKEELLNLKHEQIKKMQDKVLHSYAEMENVIDRAKREAENSKKFAIQNFARSLLDVSDNLGRASSVVKERFLKIDASKDSVGAVPLLKTLLEGVEMTDKQLAEVFKKFGVEKYDPIGEHFDPHRHHAVFQVPDASKPDGTIAAVLKPGYELYDRVIRPAEVGVTQSLNNEVADQSPEN